MPAAFCCFGTAPVADAAITILYSLAIVLQLLHLCAFPRSKLAVSRFNHNRVLKLCASLGTALILHPFIAAVRKLIHCTYITHRLPVSHSSPVVHMPATRTCLYVHAHIPIRAHLSIPIPPPFLLNSGAPPIPWQGWCTVFSSYLRLLEEEQGAQLPAIVRNSLPLSLIGTWGLQQLAKSPVMAILSTASHVAFVQIVASYFKHLLSEEFGCVA